MFLRVFLLTFCLTFIKVYVTKYSSCLPMFLKSHFELYNPTITFCKKYQCSTYDTAYFICTFYQGIHSKLCNLHIWLNFLTVFYNFQVSKTSTIDAILVSHFQLYCKIF